MAVEFRTDEPTARYGTFHRAPSRAELERYTFLDDADREAVPAKSRSHNRLGYAVQLASVRYLGRFMPDTRQVPAMVTAYVAEELEIAGPSRLTLYGERGSELDRLRRGPVRVAGPQMKRELQRAEEIVSAQRAGMAGLPGPLRAAGGCPRRLRT
ncbi:DUF4158 domain-containing protein [Streptomyces kronopolitis]|uniref:DUF4158 domain-containing protein n=1 Tax=Streptomyces kronopolitis TaxID=1612435 RepID=UPI003D9629D7